MDYFNIEDYINNIKNNNCDDIKDKLGNSIKVGDKILVKDESNLFKNCVTGIVTDCFIKKDKPIIRIDRRCSFYEEKKNYYTDKSCNDEQISYLCLKNNNESNLEHNFEEINLK